MVGNVRYNRRDRRWEAYIEYRDDSGKRRCKSRYSRTEEEARIGLRHLCEDNSDLLRKTKQAMLTPRKNEVVSYVCPSCTEERHVRNKRIIRYEGAAVGICQACYRLGPVKVGNNLRSKEAL